MMPLTWMKAGQQSAIRMIGGKASVKQHLENLGFVAGANVTVISEINGNMIVGIKESRVAISRELASKILV